MALRLVRACVLYRQNEFSCVLIEGFLFYSLPIYKQMECVLLDEKCFLVY
jgi:hypothetical protein